MSNKTDVLIVGGGIIGAACAAELARRGAKVTVLDKGRIGHGCSYGNAGWVTPCFALPLPMPGMLLKALRWQLDRDSPLYIQPRCSWALVKWLARFARSMNQATMKRSVAALTELSTFSLAAYRELDAGQPGAFAFQQRGLLMVAQSAAGCEAARLNLDLVRRHGISGAELGGSDVRKLEPAITGAKVCGGVFFPNEADVEPLAAVAALIKHAQDRQAEVWSETEVLEVVKDRRRIKGVHTTRGWIAVDQVVWAVGAWSPQFARDLELRIPVLSGKGYAVILPPLLPTPSMPCMLIEKKVAVTPRATTVRLAGTLELVGMDESITARRVQAIIRGAREYMNVPAEPAVIETWRGLRPCTPDGVPIISRIPQFDNAVLATGHQMLGLQTAPATGRLVADLVLHDTPAFDPDPFRAERF